MAITARVTINRKSISTTNGKAAGPFVYGPLTVTVDRGKQPGDRETRTASFTISDRSGDYRYLTDGNEIAIEVAGAEVFRGVISEIKLGRGRKHSANPSRRGIDAQVTAVESNRRNDDAGLRPTGSESFPGLGWDNACTQLIAAAEASGLPGTVFTPPSVRHSEYAVHMQSFHANFDASTLGKAAALLAENQACRWRSTGTEYTFTQARFDPANSTVIPASLILDGWTWSDRRLERTNVVTVSYRPDSGALPKNEWPRHRWILPRHLAENGPNIASHDVPILGKDYASALAKDRISAPQTRWMPDDIVVLLGQADKFGWPIKNWLDQIFGYRDLLPSVWIDGVPRLGVPMNAGGVVESAELTVNPSATGTGRDRANLKISISGGDVKQLEGTPPAIPTTWAQQTTTWAQHSKIWEA